MNFPEKATDFKPKQIIYVAKLQNLQPEVLMPMMSRSSTSVWAALQHPESQTTNG